MVTPAALQASIVSSSRTEPPGCTIAATFASCGASVMLSSRKQDLLEAAAAEMEGDTAVFAATGADVTHVVVEGKLVVRAGDAAEVGRELTDVLGRLWEEIA